MKKKKSVSSSSAQTPQSKDELFWTILDAALKLDLMKGHLRWKMTDLSRASGVTRTLIYYYFGNSKEAIMQAAVDVLGEEFFGLSEARQALWDQGRGWESIEKTRQLVRKMPYIAIFYLTQRQAVSPLSKKIRELEKRYLKKLSDRLPGISPDRLQAVFATAFGLVTLGEECSEKGLQSFIMTLFQSCRQ